MRTKRETFLLHFLLFKIMCSNLEIVGLIIEINFCLSLEILKIKPKLVFSFFFYTANFKLYYEIYFCYISM